ncbi:hypothetical protein [Streptomyces sp. 184]
MSDELVARAEAEGSPGAGWTGALVGPDTVWTAAGVTVPSFWPAV